MGSHKRIPWRRCKVVKHVSDYDFNLSFVYPETLVVKENTYIQHKIVWDKKGVLRGYYRVMKVNRKTRIVCRADGSAEIQVQDMEQE